MLTVQFMETTVATRAGLLDLKQAQEWVVTTKLGGSDKRPGTQARLRSWGAGGRACRPVLSVPASLAVDFVL